MKSIQSLTTEQLIQFHENEQLRVAEDELKKELISKELNSHEIDLFNQTYAPWQALAPWKLNPNPHDNFTYDELMEGKEAIIYAIKYDIEQLPELKRIGESHDYEALKSKSYHEAIPDKMERDKKFSETMVQEIEKEKQKLHWGDLVKALDHVLSVREKQGMSQSVGLSDIPGAGAFVNGVSPELNGLADLHSVGERIYDHNKAPEITFSDSVANIYEMHNATTGGVQQLLPTINVHYRSLPDDERQYIQSLRNVAHHADNLTSITKEKSSYQQEMVKFIDAERKLANSPYVQSHVSIDKIAAPAPALVSIVIKEMGHIVNNEVLNLQGLFSKNEYAETTILVQGNVDHIVDKAENMLTNIGDIRTKVCDQYASILQKQEDARVAQTCVLPANEVLHDKGISR